MAVISSTLSITKASPRLQIDMIDNWERGYGKSEETYYDGLQRPPVGTYRFFYWLGQHESAYRTCCQILKMYHFREGLEFTNEQQFPDEVKELVKFFKKVNSNYQTFLQVLFEVEDDLNIIDDCFLCFSRSYILDGTTGEIVYSEIKEIYRGSPLFYRFCTRDNTRIGGVYGRCLSCEAEMLNDITYAIKVKSSRGVTNPYKQVVFEYKTEDYDLEKGYFLCPICRRKLHDVEFFVTETADTDNPMYFHIKGEVIHTSKYNPSKMYGLSPIVTLANQVDVRIRLHQYLQSFLEYNRAPQGAIFINSNNPERIRKVLQDAQVKYMEDRYYLPIISVDTDKAGGNFVQYIRLTPMPEELKLHETQNDLKREIAAFLGVQNVMLNDLEGVGGLNSESLQVQVTDRAALAGQMVYNDVLFPRLMDALGEYGQYDIPNELRLIVKRTDNAENETRMANLERMVNIVYAIKDLGYEAEPDFTNLLGYDNKKLLPFSFRKLSKQEQMEQQQIEEGTNRDDRVKTPQQVYHSKIPGFRTKEYIETKELGGEIFYKVYVNPYEYTYVNKKAYLDIKKEELEEELKVKEERQRKVNDFTNRLVDNITDDTRLLYYAVSIMSKVYKDPDEIITKAIDIVTDEPEFLSELTDIMNGKDLANALTDTNINDLMHFDGEPKVEVDDIDVDLNNLDDEIIYYGKPDDEIVKGEVSTDVEQWRNSKPYGYFMTNEERKKILRQLISDGKSKKSAKKIVGSIYWNRVRSKYKNKDRKQ